jgi:lysophospholipase L1-like esterase
MVDENKGLKSEYTTDGVHPNEAGYKLMSGIAEKIVLQTTS